MAVIRLSITPETFRSFEVDTFVKVQPNDDNPGKYTLIFDSIHRTPVHAFDRKQRAKVFNRVLENLLQITFLTPQLMKNHLKLLIGYLAHPNNLLNIVQHPSGFPEDLGDTNHQNTALIRIAETLNHTPGVDVEAVNLLKLLARRVLE